MNIFPETKRNIYRQDFCAIMESGKLGMCPLLSKVYSLEEIDDALDDLEAGRVVRPMIDMRR